MPMPTIVGVGTVISGIGAVTAPYPGGYTAVADDIALTFCECINTNTIVPPSGWATVFTSTVATGTVTELVCLWRRVVGGDVAPSIADPGDHIIARMIIVRGCVTTGNPWDIAPTSQELAADTTVSIPGGTTSVADCLVLAAFSTGQDISSTAGATGWTNASLASLTERMDGWTTNGNGGGFAMASGEKAAAGVVSATTATLSLAANFKALGMIALKGAAAAPVPPILVMGQRN